MPSPTFLISVLNKRKGFSFVPLYLHAVKKKRLKIGYSTIQCVNSQIRLILLVQFQRERKETYLHNMIEFIITFNYSG